MRILSIKIALRYLFSRKSHSVVNMIASVAVIAIAVPLTAAILVLSLQTGLTNYVQNLFKDFDPPIVITTANQKPFTISDSLINKLKENNNIKTISASIHGDVIISYDEGEQYVATIIGVDSNYNKVVPIEQRITHGTYATKLGDLNQAIVGQGIAYNLDINPALKKNLTIYALAPKKTTLLPIPIYNKADIMPTAIFAMDEATDSKYLFTDIKFADKILAREGKINALNIKPADNISPQMLKSKLLKSLPPQYTILTTEQQRGSLFAVMNIERWVIFALLMMITAIASLSLTGAIVMMNTEKKIQNNALIQMGLKHSDIRCIFAILGIIITTIGIIIGVAAGITLTLIQEKLEILKMGGSSLLLESYPVSLNGFNVIISILSASLVGIAISTVTARSLKTDTE